MWCLAKCIVSEYFKTGGKPQETNIKVKFGRAIVVSYRMLLLINIFIWLVMLLCLVYSFLVILKAINIRVHFGSYLNMITKNDGDTLSTCLAMPAVICYPICFGAAYFDYKFFSAKRQKKLNNLAFIFIIFCIGICILFFILCIVVLANIYAAHEARHDGIIDAMKNYSTDSMVKMTVDMLQIEFQCCGSKKYDEWYEIDWYDHSLVKAPNNKSLSGETPFSCCSVKSVYPCIHHGIEKAGVVYLYTPESNLSVSLSGCHEMIKTREQKIGWQIIGKIFLLLLIVLSICMGLRLLQTAHFEHYKFDGRNQEYTIWLCGCYVGRRKKKNEIEPPPVPPFPPELQD